MCVCVCGAPLDVWTDGGSLNVFSRMLTMVLVYRELLLFWGMDMEFRDKTMLHCFKKVEGQPGFTLGT